MFDKTLKIRIGSKFTGLPFGMVLHATTRKLKIKLKNAFDLMDWMEAIIDSINLNAYC